MDDPDALLNQFLSMGTADHASLISQFQQIVPGIPEETATFFLEANHWSLQPAIASFYEMGGPSSASGPAPQAEFVCDITIGEGEEIPPGTSFDKTWRLRNNGTVPWPASTHLQLTRGDAMGAPSYVKAPQLEPGEFIDVTMRMRAPSAPGSYASAWRLVFDEGFRQFFGDEIWVVIVVAEGGTLSLTQQLHSTSFGAHDREGTRVLWQKPEATGQMPIMQTGTGSPFAQQSNPASFSMAQPAQPSFQSHAPFGSLDSYQFGSSANAFFTHQQPQQQQDDQMRDD